MFFDTTQFVFFPNTEKHFVSVYFLTFDANKLKYTTYSHTIFKLHRFMVGKIATANIMSARNEEKN